MEGSLLSSGYSTPDEVDRWFSQRCFSTDRIGVEWVPTVDDDISGFEKWDELSDHSIDWRSCFHHDHDFTWALERGYEFRQWEIWDECTYIFLSSRRDLFLFLLFYSLLRSGLVGILPSSVFLYEFLCHFLGTIVYGDWVSLWCYVASDIGSHDGEADHGDMIFLHRERRYICEVYREIAESEGEIFCKNQEKSYKDMSISLYFYEYPSRHLRAATRTWRQTLSYSCLRLYRGYRASMRYPDHHTSTHEVSP